LNTGAFSPGADTLALVTAGSNRLHITSAGLVGIGTTSPSANLQVTASGSASNVFINSDIATSALASRIALGNSVNTGRATFGLLGGGGEVAYLGSEGNFPLYFQTNGSERVRITATGNVGIGTTGPTQLLSLASASGNSYIEVAGGGYTLGTNSVYSGQDSSGNGVMWNRGNNYLLFGTNNTERVRIDNSGRLLVGTSSSSYAGLLTVSGNATSSTGHGILQLQRGSNATAAGNDLGAIWFGDGLGGNRATIEAMADAAGGAGDLPSRLVFSVSRDGSASPVERMRIRESGEIGTFGAGDGIGVSSAVGAGTTNHLFIGQHSASAVLGGTISFRVWTNGNVINTNNSYGAISDIKLKENIVDAASQWDDLKGLQVRNYNLKEGQTHTQIGLVAQEVELVSPGLVSESPDRDTEGNDLGTVTKSVNYSVLYMKAVKALQEAMERIEALEADVAQLKGA
jgi:hypothetical protein